MSSAASDVPFRVLPALGEENRFFWTSGEEALLRFLRCQACGFYLHPPLPRCPSCWSADVAPEAVSGRGEVWSFTVNHHPWDGGTEPYSIIVVAFAEQEGLRLTSNLVGCAPEAVRIGMPVEVCFERHDDVWFPLFRPLDEASG